MTTMEQKHALLANTATLELFPGVLWDLDRASVYHPLHGSIDLIRATTWPDGLREGGFSFCLSVDAEKAPSGTARLYGMQIGKARFCIHLRGSVITGKAHTIHIGAGEDGTAIKVNAKNVNRRTRK